MDALACVHLTVDATATEPSLVTVATVLATPELQRGVPEVVAGADGLGRPVRWVHAAEKPDIAALLKGGELLLTTGLGMQRAAADQRRFVRELSARSVAGVVIELGSRFDSVPEAIRDEAERATLPLIALHREVRFVDITEAIHREIVNRQFELMRRGDEVHRRFRNLLLDGAGVPEVLDALAEVVDNPVMLERAGHGLLYHSAGRSGEPAALAGWASVAGGLGGAPQFVEQAIPVAGDDAGGRVVAIGIDSPLDESDRVAVERAGELIALALLRDREEDRLVGRERGNFLLSLLRGEAIDERAAGERARALGFPHAGRMLPIIAARSVSASAAAGSEARVWSRLWSDVLGRLADRRLAVLAGTREHERELLCVVGIPGRADRTELMDRVAAIAHE
ncbi:MAG TPA: PucR family transcriptional regulator ligand-binding domain-containing protein, partial [Thermoleophilaceae bacterium]|nr:PucR family transcriptional regulator ligand-binding domain-containing protein [Thermoleophilaceae bacterium]